ncbi:MAG TPA: serine hydrolase domain-containing protein [Candidatus Tectomicrobia bacterium]
MPNTQAIDHVLRQAVHAHDVPGVVATAATDQGIMYEGAFGTRELGTDAAMMPDTVVWIASMTKAITSAAAMHLVERGQLTLDAPAADVVPELAQVQVLAGFDASGTPQLRAPKRAMTLKHLLTHTAGFGLEIFNADIVQYQAVTGTPGIITCENAALMTPLLFDPGERWGYGINTEWVGKVVEAVSGQRLGDYLQQNLLVPLGMHSTSFKISPSQRARLASMHTRGPDEALAVFPFEIPQEPQFQNGGGGLYSTAPDYLRFTQMLLHRGTFNGHQVLQPETVHTMAQNHIGDLDCVELQAAMPELTHPANFFPGMPQKWGLGFLINTAQTPQGRSPGSLAWAGLANTFFWIDPTKRVTGVFLTQMLPFFDPKAIALFRDYEAAVYQAL